MKGSVLYIRKYFNILFLIMICLSMLLLSKSQVNVWQQTNATLDTGNKVKLTVVVDAGHPRTSIG